jgi:NAD(P)-dependent dehydrogenase (short-subunit alcohol dehydrogenase family)
MAEQPRKTYVITGATSGIGRAVTEKLAARRHNVLGIARNQERALAAQQELAGAFPGARIAYLAADLSLQRNIRALAAEVQEKLTIWRLKWLDGLVNNAGTFTFWQELTAEGFETQWAVNHLAPFLLTHQLLPLLQAAPAARVVTVSSGSHYGARLYWDDLQLMRRYNPLRAYKQTKLANVIFTVEMNRRLGPESRIQLLAADPGLVDTDIGRKSNSWLSRFIWSVRRRGGIPAEKSAEGIVELLLNPDLELNDQQIYWKHGRPKDPDPIVFDASTGWRLWEVSARMCGLQSKRGAKA